MGRDKKAIGGLTFVLDGPDGVEVVPGVAEADARAALEDDHMSGIVLLLSGPNLNLLGEREPEIYGTGTLDDHVAAARAVAETHDLELEHLQSNHEGELVDAVHGAPRPLRRDRHQRRRPHALRPLAAGRARRLRRSGRGAAPLQPGRP